MSNMTLSPTMSQNPLILSKQLSCNFSYVYPYLLNKDPGNSSLIHPVGLNPLYESIHMTLLVCTGVLFMYFVPLRTLVNFFKREDSSLIKELGHNSYYLYLKDGIFHNMRNIFNPITFDFLFTIIGPIVMMIYGVVVVSVSRNSGHDVIFFKRNILYFFFIFSVVHGLFLKVVEFVNYILISVEVDRNQGDKDYLKSSFFSSPMSLVANFLEKSVGVTYASKDFNPLANKYIRVLLVLLYSLIDVIYPIIFLILYNTDPDYSDIKNDLYFFGENVMLFSSSIYIFSSFVRAILDIIEVLKLYDDWGFNENVVTKFDFILNNDQLTSIVGFNSRISQIPEIKGCIPLIHRTHIHIIMRMSFISLMILMDLKSVEQSFVCFMMVSGIPFLWSVLSGSLSYYLSVEQASMFTFFLMSFLKTDNCVDILVDDYTKKSEFNECFFKPHNFVFYPRDMNESYEDNKPYVNFFGYVYFITSLLYLCEIFAKKINHSGKSNARAKVVDSSGI